ncbi:hypothetical protein [Dyadobacter sp. CY326]|uniref:hypothetical protein n=1 Tax=Dyadobacter sp. CY326 TaxID=2907300 RepID=UPI001F1AA40E|nr:hypothetical protein [Dyadobacter sp. CY326]MCE7065648.1 hypothetical protein [Dyadobacter sp. CY326]
MKTFHIEVIKESEQELIKQVLASLKQKGMIDFKETSAHVAESVPASDEQVQEIIEEAELAPFYSEKEAKNILNL